jgi:hypothetical protein
MMNITQYRQVTGLKPLRVSGGISPHFPCFPDQKSDSACGGDRRSKGARNRIENGSICQNNCPQASVFHRLEKRSQRNRVGLEFCNLGYAWEIALGAGKKRGSLFAASRLMYYF